MVRLHSMKAYRVSEGAAPTSALGVVEWSASHLANLLPAKTPPLSVQWKAVWALQPAWSLQCGETFASDGIRNLDRPSHSLFNASTELSWILLYIIFIYEYLGIKIHIYSFGYCFISLLHLTLILLTCRIW
jgi:hypothetical protein